MQGPLGIPPRPPFWWSGWVAGLVATAVTLAVSGFVWGPWAALFLLVTMSPLLISAVLCFALIALILNRRSIFPSATAAASFLTGGWVIAAFVTLALNVVSSRGSADDRILPLAIAVPIAAYAGIGLGAGLLAEFAHRWWSRRAEQGRKAGTPPAR